MVLVSHGRATVGRQGVMEWWAMWMVAICLVLGVVIVLVFLIAWIHTGIAAIKEWRKK